MRLWEYRGGFGCAGFVDTGPRRTATLAITKQCGCGNTTQCAFGLPKPKLETTEEAYTVRSRRVTRCLTPLLFFFIICGVNRSLHSLDAQNNAHPFSSRLLCIIVAVIVALPVAVELLLHWRLQLSVSVWRCHANCLCHLYSGEPSCSNVFLWRWETNETE